MDPITLIQLVFAGTGVVILGRVGFALSRYIERRLSGSPASHLAESRLQAVEAECTLLRQELDQLQERQDFSERMLQQPPARPPR
jgi:hypothetical protein